MLKRSILVVDDEEDWVDVSVATLQELGYKAEGVRSSEACVEKLKHEKFDMVLTDMGLSIFDLYSDGDELAKAIKGAYPEIRVVIQTGFSVNGTEQTSADMLMKKHVSPEERKRAYQRFETLLTS